MIDLAKGLVEDILEDYGAEAIVKLQKRVVFYGLGSDIRTEQAVRTALRIEHTRVTLHGHVMFIRHAILKKLDDYFFRKGVYTTPHIPRPLGSISDHGDSPFEAYFYEWALGGEGFAWEVMDNHGDRTPVTLREWREFVSYFGAAGIDLQYDTADVDNGALSKNIIHAFPGHVDVNGELSTDWSRIDFGMRSIIMDYTRLDVFLHENRDELIALLRPTRYDMLVLGLRYLQAPGGMNSYDIARLEDRIEEYRLATLDHFLAHCAGVGGMPVQLDYRGERTQSLILSTETPRQGRYRCQ